MKPEEIDTYFNGLNPLILCGHPKSGTTLMIALLDSHPELLVFPEEANSYDIMLQPDQESRVHHVLHHSEARLPGEGLIAAYSGERDYRHIDGAAYLNDLRNLLEQADGARESLLAVFKNWLRHNPPADPKKLRYFVEKTPNNELLYSSFRSWFPNVRFIHIVRDPRDNYASYLKKRDGWRLEKFAYNWLRSTRLAFERQDSGHYLMVRYEDLVGKAEEVLQKICAFLKIEFRPSLLTPTKGGTLWKGNSMFGHNEGAIHTKSSGQYKEHLSREQIEILESYLYPEMAALGYAPEAASGVKSLPPGFLLNEKAHFWVWKMKTHGRVPIDFSTRNRNRGYFPHHANS